jgi:tRNA 2-thiouridine synthesizing protein A
MNESTANTRITPDRRLDVSGTLCPIPVVKARAELRGMAAGQVLEVLATDPLAELDLVVMCEHGGHELIAAESSADRVRVLIRAAAAKP